MPFVPLTSEEKELYPEPCQHPEHDPPGNVLIRRAMKWVCPACGDAVILQPPMPSVVKCGPRKTRSQILKDRSTVHGCCNRHADNMACECLTLAEYDRTQDNGCSICRDPNCDSPNGKH